MLAYPLPEGTSGAQAAACAWLGHWYKDANDWVKARNCYKCAAELAPGDAVVADNLAAMEAKLATLNALAAAEAELEQRLQRSGTLDSMARAHSANSELAEISPILLRQ